MADYLGTRPASSVVRFSFTTHAASGAIVAPNSAFENADLRIYKDGSATQRSSSAGITMTSPFDSVTGLHHVDIDLSDNTDAGFYAAGSFYEVHLVPDETVDSLAVVKVLTYFDIGVPVANVTQVGGVAVTATGGRQEVNVSHIAGSAVSTSTAQLGVNVVNFGGSAGSFASGVPAVNATQISGDATAADNLETAYDDTAGPVHWVGIVDQGTAQSVGATSIVLRSAAAFVDDALIGCTVVITNGTQIGSRSVITDYVGSTDTATLGNGWTGATPTGTPTYKIFASAAGSGVAQTGDAYAIVASGTFGNAAIKTAVDGIPAATLDLTNGVETSITLRQALRLILAANAGKLSGAATTTITIRNVGDSKDRITATVDADGNRTAVTTDAT